MKHQNHFAILLLCIINGKVADALATSSYNSQSQTQDWALYNEQKQYQKSGGILYKQSVLTPQEYNTIVNELQSMDLMLKDEETSSFATNRIGAKISKESEVYRVLSCEDGSLSRLINALADADDDNDDKSRTEKVHRKMVVAPDIPCEVWYVHEFAYASMSLAESVTQPFLHLHRYVFTKSKEPEWNGTLMM